MMNKDSMALDAVLDALDDMVEAFEKMLSMEEKEPAPFDDEQLPRPPRRLGPINKTNYTARNPPRRARSSCYKRHK